MKRILDFAAGYPWLVIIGLLAASLTAATQVPRLQVDIATDGMLAKHTPAWQDYERSRRTFGSDSVTVVYLQDPRLFDPDNLQEIRRTIDALTGLAMVTRVESLFSAINLENNQGEISAKPYLHEIPTDAARRQSIIRAATDNPLIVGSLISPDGSSMALNVHLTSGKGADFQRAAANAIEGAIEPLRERLRSVFQIGAAAIHKALKEKILADQRVILPLSVMVLALTVVVTLRRLNGALIPLATAALSVLWTLGLMAWLGLPLNMMTSIVPALIVIIGSTEDIHLLSEYYTASPRRGNQDSLARMSRNMGTAVSLTFITTYLGFLSVALSDIEPLRQFGLVASTGLLCNFCITVLLIPAWLRLLDSSRPREPEHTATAAYGNIAARLLGTVSRCRKTTLGIFAALVFLAAYGATGMRIDNNSMDYFNAHEPLIRHAETLHENLAGLHSFAVLVEAGIDDTFLKVKYLDELRKIQDQLRAMEVFDKTLSFADFIAHLNGVMQDDGYGSALPEGDDIVREYMLFVDHDTVRPLVSANFSAARILVRHNIASSHELRGHLEKLRIFLANHADPALRISISGESVLADLAADAMAKGQLESLLLMLMAILIIVSILFLNIKAGLVAVIPNLLPILSLFGVMGYFQIPLDAGSSMVAAVALGICVDDTMHFMARYHKAMQELKDEAAALTQTVRLEALPVFSTSASLAAGFLVLSLSGFAPIARFGLLSAMVIVLALLATFTLTPLLLRSLRLITVWDMLSLQVRAELIRDSELLAGMRPMQARKFILLSDLRDYRRGDVIIRQGDAGNELFLILEGEVEALSRQTNGSTRRLRNLSAGSVFGELALLSRQPRSATVVATTPARLLALEWESINRFARIFPHIAAKLFRNISAITGQRMVSRERLEIPIRDDISGLYTRGYLDQRIATETAVAQRYEEPLSLLLLNTLAPCSEHDDYPAETASATAQCGHEHRHIVRQLRDADVFAQWEQGVYAILLPRTDRAGAECVKQRLTRITNVDAASGWRAAVAQLTPEESLSAFIGRCADALKEPPRRLE